MVTRGVPPRRDGPDRPSPGAVAVFSIASRLNRLPIVGLHRRAVLAVGTGLFFDLYEVFLSSVLIVVLVREFAVPEAAVPALISSVFVGMFVGTAVLTVVADRIGRRTAFLLTIGIYSAASFIGAFSQDVWFLVAMRFVAGLGIGAEFPVTDTYLADLLPAQRRGRYISWAYTLGFCGVPVAGVIASTLVDVEPFGISGWRWMFALGAVGALLVWFQRRRLPESPRWLESVGRKDEAARIVAGMEAQAVALGSIAAPRHDIDASPRLSVVEAIGSASGSLRRRLVMMALFQPMQGIGYFGFTTMAVLVLTQRGFTVTTSSLFVAATYLGYPIGSLLTVPMIERVDRRLLIVVSGLAIVLTGTVYVFAPSPTWIIVFGFLYTSASNVFSNAFHVYQVELFPTELRARGAGWPYATSRLAIGMMPFVLVPVLQDHGAPWAFGITGAAMFVAVVMVAALGPSTTGRALELIGSDDRR